MIYFIVSMTLIPGKTQEFSEILEKEYLPLAEKHGIKLIGSWQTAIGSVDEITNILAFDSLGQFEKIRQSQFQDLKYLEVRSKLKSLMTAETVKVVNPLPCSPLK